MTLPVQLKQQLRSALVAGQWRGDTALALPLFWRRSTVSPVFFGRCTRSSLHSFVLSPPPSPSLISHLASVDVKQNVLMCAYIVQELCESRGVPWHWSQFVPNKTTDIRRHEALHHHHRARFRVQELCESRGGRLGLPSLISLGFLWT